MHSLRLLPTSLLGLLTSTAAGTSHAERDGVHISTLKKADCGRPTQKGDVIVVDYRGHFESGEVFDSSYERGTPFHFTVGAGQVIKGWDMGLLNMCPGEERELIIPPELAYGVDGTQGIPPNSVLIFETLLRDIAGVKQPEIVSTTQPESTFAASTALRVTSSTTIVEPHGTASVAAAEEEQESSTGNSGAEKGPLEEEAEKHKKRCQLLGPFALLVQAALGGFAILTLVYKRYRESPQRPWKIWFFDVSKQVFGSMLTHVLNVGMSMLSSIQIANHAEKFGDQIQAASKAQGEQGHYPNPCSYYLLNLAIDTTLGIPVLWILLIVVHALFLRTPLANPPQSLKSGNYGEPPKWTWYLKQLLIYFIGLTGMKFAVFLLFSALPWLPWVGDWALRWTQFDERLEIAFAMFIFPLLMNGVQYYIIDNLIMDKKRDTTGYQAVQEDEEHAQLTGDESTIEVEDEDDRFKLDDDDDDDLKPPGHAPVHSGERGTSGEARREAAQASLLRTEDDVSRKLK